MTRHRRGLVGLLLVLLSCTLVQAGARDLVTAKDLLSNPARFDGKLVTLSGRPRTPQLVAGPVPTYTFLLDDRTQVVTVVARGAPICQPTQQVSVEGWFRAAAGPGLGFGHVEAVSVICR